MVEGPRAMIYPGLHTLDSCPTGLEWSICVWGSRAFSWLIRYGRPSTSICCKIADSWLCCDALQVLQSSGPAEQ